MDIVYTVLAIGSGSALGALLRYGLSIALNAYVPQLPMGTLSANWIAAYVVGAAISFFASAQGLSPLWRLFIVTGFAGGLSTFSTFSAELFSLLRDGRLNWSAGMVVLHVGGSLIMVALGAATVVYMRFR